MIGMAVLLPGLLLQGPAAPPAGLQDSAGEITVELEKISRFEAGDVGEKLASSMTVVCEEAVLIDPAMDVMIRGLTDSRWSREVTYEDASGNSRSYRQPLPLDPKVIIIHENSERVAEGVMPFG